MKKRSDIGDNEFHRTETYRPVSAKEKLLIEALADLKDSSEMADFLRDLLTLSEIKEFSNRIYIAKMLLEGKSYLDIAKLSGASTTTVTRVAHWLYRGCGGYYRILRKIKK